VTQRGFCGFLAALALLSGAGAPALGGDADFARFLFVKAEKAFRARRYEAAEESYRKALAQLTPFPEAAYGLGRTLERLERPRDAMAAYRTCREQIETSDVHTPAWKSLAARAGRALERLRRRFSALEKLDRGFVRSCLTYARRYKETQPAWARTALESALAVDPGNKAATRLLLALPEPGKARQAPKPAARGTPLVKSATMQEWDPGLSGEWSCEAGVVRGDVEGPQGKLNWLQDPKLAGDYTVTVRMRLLRKGGPKRTFGLFLGGNGRDSWWTLLVTSDDELILDRFEGGSPRPMRDFILRGFDPRKRHTLKATVKHGELTVHFDNRQAFEIMADDRTAFDGMLALFVQDAGVEFTELRAER